MILTRFLAPVDLLDRVRAMVPRATDADIAALAVMVPADKLLSDDGKPHPAFVNWLAGILERRAA